MPIFTLAATALLAGTALAGSTFAIGLTAAALGVAANIGLSYVAKALSGSPASATSANHFSTQGTLNAGGDVPRSMLFGYCSTAGSLVWANTWGTHNSGQDQSPNAYFTQVIALSDLPVNSLQQVWVNGQLCTIDLDPAREHPYGNPLVEYRKDNEDHLWIKFYDGTQTVADPFLVNISSTARPYETTRVGTGVAYVICTALVNDTLFTGFPSYKFALNGVKLYDPSKDSTVGGSGSHRYNDQTTWGGDGDFLPAVQLYNLFRGVSYNGVWLYGLQNVVANRLPLGEWIAAIAACRTTITGTSGLEPTYRSGGEIPVNTQMADAVDALLGACAGRVAEIGGFYKLYVGAPGAAAYSFTDDVILSSVEQTFNPFFTLADSVNGITAKYPSPAQGWTTVTAPPLYSPTFEAQDGNRRLLSDVTLNFVPYDAQVQRLMKSALDEARRARRHTITLPSDAWKLEPGDIVSWTSTRNGYVTKAFRIDAMADKANLDVMLTMTEVDASDYSWTHSVDFTPVVIGSLTGARPPAQTVANFTATAATILDAGGLSRRPAIELGWDGAQPGLDGFQYQIRLAATATIITSGNDRISSGSLIISESILPNTVYEARGLLIPSSPRDVTWSAWISVTTPDVKFGLQDFSVDTVGQVTTITDYLNDKIDFAVQQIAAITANQDARNWLDQQTVRSQIASRSDAALAAVESVQQAYTSADAALALSINTVSARLGRGFSSVETIAKAFADRDSTFATYQTLVSATFGSSFSSVNTVSSAVATLNGYAAASYAVTLDVNGYVIGTNLVNGGLGTSAFTVTVDKFQIASPGVSGGAAVPIFTVANVGGSPKVALRGDMVVDGTITGTMIAANTITAAKIAAGTITANELAANTVTASKIAAGTITATEIASGTITAAKLVGGTITATSGILDSLAVKTINIQGNAVTIPNASTVANFLGTGSGASIFNYNVSVDTTGLTGDFKLYVIAMANKMNFTATNVGWAANLFINGTQVMDVAGTNNDYPLLLSGALAITATGGVQSINVTVNWNCSNSGTIVKATCFSIVARR